MVFLAGLLHGVHVYDGTTQVAQAVHESVVDLAGYRVPLGDGQARDYSVTPAEARRVGLGQELPTGTPSLP